jgi:hypothetical protein
MRYRILTTDLTRSGMKRRKTGSGGKLGQNCFQDLIVSAPFFTGPFFYSQIRGASREYTDRSSFAYFRGEMAFDWSKLCLRGRNLSPRWRRVFLDWWRVVFGWRHVGIGRSRVSFAQRQNPFDRCNRSFERRQFAFDRPSARKELRRADVIDPSASPPSAGCRSRSSSA